MYLVNRLRTLVRNDEGQDLLEYALLVALIAIVCIAAITLLGGNASTNFSNVANSIGN